MEESMPLLATGVLAAVLLLVFSSWVLARRAARAQRALAGQIRALRRELREVSGRLENAEKSAGDAATRAEVAGSVLLEKGLANEEDLEAARRRFDAPDDAQPVRGSRTLH
jgi:type II secretory pathway pseudopilin PulG